MTRDERKDAERYRICRKDGILLASSPEHMLIRVYGDELDALLDEAAKHTAQPVEYWAVVNCEKRLVTAFDSQSDAAGYAQRHGFSVIRMVEA